MKKRILQLILPFTILSMFVVTKWWFVLPVDGPNKMMYGFPLMFMGEGFHTSLSVQFFGFEFLVDFLVYFTIWTLLILGAKRLFQFEPHRYVSIGVWLLSGILIALFFWVLSFSNPMFHFKRPFEATVLDTGSHFIWEDKKRPSIEDYHWQNAE